MKTAGSWFSEAKRYETSRENWSFGNGIAQYADVPPPHLGK
jgi:hypothetical protein